jgi:hypothetical protein
VFHTDDLYNVSAGLFGWPPASIHPRALLQIVRSDICCAWIRLQARLNAERPRGVHYLPFVGLPVLRDPLIPSADERTMYPADVSFLGYCDRERWLAPLCAAGADMAIWGQETWERARPILRRAYHGRLLIGREMRAR